MNRPLVLLVGLAACGPQITVPGQDSTGADGGSTGTDGDGSFTGAGPSTTAPPAATTSAGTTDPGDSTAMADASGSSVGFIDLETGVVCAELPPGTSAHCTWCDIFAQDCPEGEKCMPWANDGGPSWNDTRCSPIDPDPRQAGETCHVEGSGVSGLDDCDLGLMCFHVDPDTLQGVCETLCSGSPEEPICPEGETCSISGEGVVNLCLETCDPLADTCPIGACVPHQDEFVCVQTVGDVPAGDACEYANECTSGAACLNVAATGECADGYACCSSYCDLTAAEPDAPCLPGQTCHAWYEPGQAPADLDHVGVCLEMVP